MVLAVCFVSVVVGLNRPQLTAKAWRIRAAAALIALGCAAGMFAESNVYDRRAAAPEFAWRTFDQASLAALAEIEAALPANASLAASWSVASHFARRDKLLHVFWLPETFIEGRYDFALLDRLDPNFTPKEDMPALTAALAADYRLIKGKPGDRILLLVRKDYVSR
jgi:hypothetical protein